MPKPTSSREETTQAPTVPGIGEPADLTQRGALALCLFNSLNWRLSEEPEDILDVERLLVVAQINGGLTLAPGRRRASRQRLADELRALRTLLLTYVDARIDGEPLPPTLLPVLEAHWARASQLLQVDWATGEVRPRATREEDLPDLLFLSAMELTAGHLPGRLKVCEDARGCGFLFIDATRNASRRFCNDVCATYDRQARFRRNYRG
ncbi:MAG: CGNR zinc finger domain-containing protein [Hydrogenophaga sp.]|nr:CGNR zinc finger domain-containing protein [Hydrogenophaga sp.]